MNAPINKDTVDKWIMLAGLHGIAMAELWDSPDDQVEEVFNHLERLEEIEQYKKDNEAAFKVAQAAMTMGLTHDDLWRYHEYLADLAYQEEERRYQEAENNNPVLKNLRGAHCLTMTTGKSPYQTYWAFEADLGDGQRKYNCRFVRVNWYSQRIWREWTDSNGKKHKEKFEHRGHNFPFKMDDRWPERWRQQYGRNFTESQIPYAYTQYIIDSHKVKKTRKKKVKTV